MIFFPKFLQEFLLNRKIGAPAANVPDPFSDELVNTRDKDKIDLELPVAPKFKITNVIHDLPWHTTKKWGQRKISQIKNIVVHQMASNGSVGNINEYHIGPNHISKNGCPHICYHFFITRKGEIYKCNEETSITWHVKNYNTVSLGIGCQGDYFGESYAGTYKEITVSQRDALNWLLNYLVKELNKNSKDIKGHCELDPKNKPACPGYSAMNFIRKYRGEL